MRNVLALVASALLAGCGPALIGVAVSGSGGRRSPAEVVPGPTVQLGEGVFVASQDKGRGISIPYVVTDRQSDPLRVVFQWRRASQPNYEALGTDDPAALAKLLQSPRFLREKQVCSPFPAFVFGCAIPMTDRTVGLPEVRQAAATVLGRGGIEFRVLELLRSQLPAALTDAGLADVWLRSGRSNPLLSPVAALPLGDGSRALTLELQGGMALVREIELATGAARRIAEIPGPATAMHVDRDEERALVATATGTSWQVHGVELATGATTVLVSGMGESPRSLLGLNRSTALATAGNSLLRLAWAGAASPIVSLRSDLRTPWGLAEDPRRPGHVLVAEQGGNRVISVELASGASTPLAGGPLPAPTSIAIDRDRVRLIALCEAAAPSERALLALNLNRGDGTVYPVGRVRADAAAVATGDAGLLLVTLPLSRDLVAGGGVEQRRELIAFDSASATATVAAPFDPPVQMRQQWRIRTGRGLFAPLRSSPDGTSETFVWDARVVGYVDRVFVKATVVDDKLGGSSQASASRAVGSSEAIEIPAPGGPSSVAVADLDGDGDLDFVSANPGGNSLTMFAQTSPRVFTPGWMQATAAAPRSVAAADMDGDGDVDLVCATAGVAENVLVFWQTAPGTFSAPSVWTAGRDPASVAIADLDNDGDLDFACANQGSGDTTVFWQETRGSFRVQSPVASGSAPTDLEAADLDGDGFLDLVCAITNADSLVVLRSAPREGGGRTFLAEPPLACGTAPTAVVAADLDGDGDVDLACANSLPRGISGTVTILLQTAGTLAAQPPLPALSQPSALAAVDFDLDGDLDLLVANFSSNRVTVLVQGVSHTFVAHAPLVTGAGPSHLVVADMDGDGGPDVVCANTSAASVTVAFRDGLRRFGDREKVFDNVNAFSIAAGDLDRDGDVDLVGAVFLDQGGAALLGQEEPRRFGSPQISSVGGRPAAVGVADVDGDGDLDLVTADSASETVTVLLQARPGAFTALEPLAARGLPKSLALADLDGDGDVDIATANASSDDLSIFYQTSPATFAPGLRVPAGDGAGWVVAADLDRDGKHDLISADFAATTVSVLGFDQQQRTFVRRRLLTVEPSNFLTSAVAAGDVDGDGDDDIVATAIDPMLGPPPRPGRLLVYLNEPERGPFEFSSPLVLATGALPTAAVVADLDGDGDKDLACVNYIDSTVSWYLQHGPRTFVPQAALVTGSAPASLVALDLDGDGDKDLASAGVSGLSVLYGR